MNRLTPNSVLGSIFYSSFSNFQQIFLKFRKFIASEKPTCQLAVALLLHFYFPFHSPLFSDGGFFKSNCHKHK